MNERPAVDRLREAMRNANIEELGRSCRGDRSPRGRGGSRL